MVNRVLTLDGTPVTVNLEPVYWELLQARSARDGLSADRYVERNAPTRNPAALARWVRTTCVNDLRERVERMRNRLDRRGGATR
ncbi:putative DNA-binding ribbon-helix-helix protein [Azospirillum agricola]|uniref:ribbon-helix-helix domain-containing protein n=1 Tax=Azospirillum agricola TaxID=1720247 RepID=UPI001AEA09DB|nr:ribbon-helix-helix domain-containing protein [Azospirillum agricola]MBP2232346.1 putative DNA-binding ribbon-helix-helix protein [Azospirillum agricola]